jgi:phosphatidylserine/phosphatidylglycerophosphate/cardiolipin synthase-like enzyme
VVRVFFEREYLALVVGCVQEAAESILACSYEWAWYEGQRTGTVQDVNRVVCQAAKRGVAVRVLLHNEPPGRPLGGINRKSAGRLERNGVQVRMGGTGRILHAKLWVFDGVKAIICTHNVSNRAVTSNAELGVLLEDDESVGKVKAYFERLWGGVPVAAAQSGV